MLRDKPSSLTLVASVLGVVSVVQASVIFGNGTPGAGVDLAFSDPDASFILAEDFILGAADTVRGIVVWGSYFPADTEPAADNFMAVFYNDVGLGGLPGVPIGATDLTVASRVDTGLMTIFNTRIFRYELDLDTPQTVAAGTKYWVSVFNDTSKGVDPDDDWAWTEELDAGNAALSDDDGSTWTFLPSLLHFQLDNEFFGAEPCPWDLDGNGSVGTADLLDLLAQWGTSPGGPPDFDGGGVGTSDLLKLLANWGACP